MTIREATEKWVREMNAIPRWLIEYARDAFDEVTCPIIGDLVYIFGADTKGEIIGIHDAANTDKFDIVRQIAGTERTVYEIETERGGKMIASEDAILVGYEDILPIWETMWMFDNPCDEKWLEEQDGIRRMSECGFRVYRSCDGRYVFGIDSAGDDFMTKYWVPLYKARGLKWHEDGVQ